MGVTGMGFHAARSRPYFLLEEGKDAENKLKKKLMVFREFLALTMPLDFWMQDEKLKKQRIIRSTFVRCCQDKSLWRNFLHFVLFIPLCFAWPWRRRQRLLFGRKPIWTRQSSFPIKRSTERLWIHCKTPPTKAFPAIQLLLIFFSLLQLRITSTVPE